MEKSKVREPAAAGRFYPETLQQLKNQIAAFVDKNIEKSEVIACILPHAGYVYSGKVAAETVSQVKIRDKVILLGPNHTGYGAPFSIWLEGSWQTPLGRVQIDSELARQLLSSSRHLKGDCSAHTYEHSLEVELPFLQYFKSGFKIVPIAILSEDINALKQLGIEIASVVKDSKIEDSTLLVASSDMTHYEPKAEAEKKDKAAIQAILELNEDKLIEKVQGLNISMCGWSAVVTMITAAKLLGAKAGKLIKYQTSGDITGDTASVVGYAGITIY